MAKSRQEKIANYDERIAQLENQRKKEQQMLKADERKARTKRLCSRHGLLESMLPEIINITDEQYQTFLERAVANDYGRGILAKITAQGAENGTIKTPTGTGQQAATSAPKTSEQAAQSRPSTATKAAETPSQANPAQTTKPTPTPPNNATGASQNSGGGNRQTS